MKIYIQISDSDIITDVVDFPYSNYTEVEVDSIPIGIIGGWFKYEDKKIVEYPELKPKEPQDEIDFLKQEDLNNKEAISEIYMMLLDTGGML